MQLCTLFSCSVTIDIPIHCSASLCREKVEVGAKLLIQTLLSETIKLIAIFLGDCFVNIYESLRVA